MYYIFLIIFGFIFFKGGFALIASLFGFVLSGLMGIIGIIIGILY